MKIIFLGWWNIRVLYNSSFFLKIKVFNANGKGHSTVTHPFTPCLFLAYVLISCTFHATPKFQLRVAPDGRTDGRTHGRTNERAGDRSAIASSKLEYVAAVGGYILFT